MGVIYPQASFKNSRVSSRKPTTQARTYDLIVKAGASNTLVAQKDQKRTYISLRNNDLTPGNDMRFDYFDNPSMLTNGFLIKAGEAYDIESPEAIYARAVVSDVEANYDQGEG